MVYIALILGTFLFYQYVERRHKVIALKAFAVLSTIIAAGIGIMLGYDQWKAKGRNNGIEVKFDRIHFISPQFLEEEAEGMRRTAGWKASEDVIKDVLKGKVKPRDLTDVFLFLEGYKIADEGQQRKLRGTLNSQEMGLFERMRKLQALSDEKLSAQLAYHWSTDMGDKEINFEVCNRRSAPLLRYSFSVLGYENGRSTAHSIMDDHGFVPDFNSDIIISPKQCSKIHWTGKYKKFDRYEVSVSNAEWQE